MEDNKLIGALRRCMDAEVCDTDCPGYQFCIGGGGEIRHAAVESIELMQEKTELMQEKTELMARVIEGFKPLYVYFAVEKPILEMMEQLPEAGLKGFHAHERRQYIPLIDQMGHGFAIYSRRLTEEELSRCGMISAPRGTV